MKAKYALIALLAITFFGCDDNTGGLGLGMFPGNDQNIKGKLSTFDVTTKSIPLFNAIAIPPANLVLARFHAIFFINPMVCIFEINSILAFL